MTQYSCNRLSGFFSCALSFLSLPKEQAKPWNYKNVSNTSTSDPFNISPSFFTPTLPRNKSTRQFSQEIFTGMVLTPFQRILVDPPGLVADWVCFPPTHWRSLSHKNKKDAVFLATSAD